MKDNNYRPATGDILATILQRKAEQIAERQNQLPLQDLIARTDDAPAPRPFYQALLAAVAAGKPAVIAEISRAGEDQGPTGKTFDAAGLARSFEAGGATCLSIVTDEEFLPGGDEFLLQARYATSLPLLRRDFIIDPYQVYESRSSGADAVLLMTTALGDAQMRELADLAASLGMDVLVEVHNREQLERAHVLRTPLIVINNRDGQGPGAALDTTIALLLDVFPDRTIVSAGGIHDRDTVRLLRRRGVNVFLVGDTLASAADPGGELRDLFSP